MTTPKGLQIVRATVLKSHDKEWEAKVIAKNGRNYFEGSADDNDFGIALDKACQEADKEQEWRLKREY